MGRKQKRIKHFFCSSFNRIVWKFAGQATKNKATLSMRGFVKAIYYFLRLVPKTSETSVMDTKASGSAFATMI